MKCSICIATYNKPQLIQNTLQSIFTQCPSFGFEVIVVNDGSTESYTVATNNFPRVKWIILDKKQYGNPAAARNLAFSHARGEVIIDQSDDVIHKYPNTIQSLVNLLKPGKFVIAEVINIDGWGLPYRDTTGNSGYGGNQFYYVGPKKQRPLFFLGSIYREDILKIGGYDEEFTHPGREDVWYGMCLTKGLGLVPIYTAQIIGHHQHHQHCNFNSTLPSRQLYDHKLFKAERGIIPWKSEKSCLLEVVKEQA